MNEEPDALALLAAEANKTSLPADEPRAEAPLPSSLAPVPGAGVSA